MKNFLQNLKSGFANIKELFTIILGDENNDIQNTYDIYINSQDASIAKTAQELKELEEKQELKRLSLFNVASTKKKASSENKKDTESPKDKE